MTADQIRECLATRWPDSEYLVIPEAPEQSDRSGRKIDLLVISLWRSRGLEVDAIEIKISPSDWVRELKAGSKADFWWRHSHRFWVAVPADMAARVKAELPTGWGLLACAEGKPTKVVVKPLKRQAEPFSWRTCVGVMRASANCGFAALARAEARGRREGLRLAEKRVEAQSVDGRLRRELEDLRGTIREFEQKAGISIGTWDAGDIGQAVAIVRVEMQRPGWLARNLGAEASRTTQEIHRLLEGAKRVQEMAERISAQLASVSDPELESAGQRSLPIA